jgi:hypothetical protein
MMAEKVDPRFYTGLALVIAALPVHLAWVFWKKLKPFLSNSVLAEARLIAGSLRWWLGVLLVLLTAAILSPFFEERRWPLSAWLPPVPTLDQTASAVADKLAGTLPKPNDYADAVIGKLPKGPQPTAPSAGEIADAVVNKLPKPAQPAIPSAAEIAKEVARLSPQIADSQRVQELTTALNSSNKARDESSQELNALRSKLPQRSPLLGIDDATKWQLVRSLQDAAVNSQGNNRIVCHTIESIDTENKGAMELFSEFTELLARSWRVNEWLSADHSGFMSSQGSPPPPNQPFGITFLVAGHSGDAFACANHAVGILQNVLQVPISLRVDQASDNLAKCNNQCIEIRYGGER